MRPIAYRFLAAISAASVRVGTARVGTGALARPSRAKLGSCLRSRQFWLQQSLLCAALMALTSMIALTNATAETRPHYGGTLRVMMQSAPYALDLPANAAPADYWDIARTLSLIGDTLIKLDALGRPQPALAVAWQRDPSARHWEFTLRRGVKFHDGSLASPGAIAQILGALHPGWNVRASADAVSIEMSIESETAMPSLLAELALPRNLLLKRSTNDNRFPIGTGPFLVAEWQPGKRLKLAANEESWAGRPFVDAIEIEFGKSLRDQAIALELDKTDVIEAAPQAASGSQRHGTATSSSLPVELLALVFSANSKAQDARLREALALAIERKPIQSVLLKGAGEPAASILPNWMTGYSAVFSSQVNPQRARTLLAGSRQPALNLSYDPRDPQAQLIAERIALNAREVGITVQVSLSGAEDIRLVRTVLPSPDPATSLGEAARQLVLPQPGLPATRGDSLDDLYQAERSLLDGYAVIPLFHLPVASAASARVRAWEPDRLGVWSGAGQSLADLWLADSRPYDSHPNDARPGAGAR
jgi:ABC-type transport system substrate-binding protein